jgi:hypothetical protein
MKKSISNRTLHTLLGTGFSHRSGPLGSPKRKRRSMGGAMDGIATGTEMAAPMIGQALGGSLGSGIGGLVGSGVRGLSNLANGADATETARDTALDMGMQTPGLIGAALGGPLGALAGSLYMPAVTKLAEVAAPVMERIPINQARLRRR